MPLRPEPSGLEASDIDDADVKVLSIVPEQSKGNIRPLSDILEDHDEEPIYVSVTILNASKAQARALIRRAESISNHFSSYQAPMSSLEEDADGNLVGSHEHVFEESGRHHIREEDSSE